MKCSFYEPAVVDFPTPPLFEETAITCLTPLITLGGGGCLEWQRLIQIPSCRKQKPEPNFCNIPKNNAKYLNRFIFSLCLNQKYN